MFGAFAAYFGDIMQAALAAVATALMVVSLNAYRRKSEGRYFLLAVAFVCLCAVAVSTLLLDLFVGIGPGTARVIVLYLVPSLEFLMALSFLTAVLWSSRIKRGLRVVFPVAVILLGFAVVTAYAQDQGTTLNVGSALPEGCARPANGYLIVASSLGYNDSVAHGAPIRSWPVLDITEGSNVTLTICNTYQQAVGFQVVHYLQDKLETVLPGQVLTISFVADQRGAFGIYCSVFSPIHLYLQGGELRVT